MLKWASDYFKLVFENTIILNSMLMKKNSLRQISDKPLGSIANLNGAINIIIF